MGKYLKTFQPNRLKKRRTIFLLLSLLYIFGSYGVSHLAVSSKDLMLVASPDNSFSSRKLFNVEKNGTQDKMENETEAERCTEPSIKEFPSDVFTQDMRRKGAILLHFFMAVYMFIALAFVCDDYFISALDKICERLDLSEDVAGATFMAAGSSAPELFTSIIGVFITKGDVGVGTIVGSAVFNILVIIALCGLFAGQVVRLTWWPLFRDSIYYMISIAALIWTIKDGHVKWYESMIMVLLYVGYIIVMKFNPAIVNWINERTARRRAVAKRNQATSDTSLVDSKEPTVKYTQNVNEYDQIELSDNRRRLTWKELGMMIMLTDKFSPTTRFRAACLIVILRGEHKGESSATDEANTSCMNDEEAKLNTSTNHNDSEKEGSVEDSSSEIEGQPFLYPQGSCIRILFWVLSLPLVTILYFTIPDCRKPRWEAWYICTFFVSIFWIMVFSYLMVWMVCVIGFTLGIPDVIMGITFLAAGTSIPDAISSLLVAREGLGDMAVSNSIGSNIFDILIGLAIPWFIKTAIVRKEVRINSKGMVYSVGLLFASVLLTEKGTSQDVDVKNQVFVIHVNKWRLNKRLGVLFTVLYLVFVTISALIEFNVFGFVNYPTCHYAG